MIAKETVISNYPFDVLDYLVPLMVLTGACLSLLIDPVGLSRYTLALGIGFAGGYLLSRYWIKGNQISSFQIVEELARQRLQSLSTMELGQRVQFCTKCSFSTVYPKR